MPNDAREAERARWPGDFASATGEVSRPSEAKRASESCLAGAGRPKSLFCFYERRLGAVMISRLFFNENHGDDREAYGFPLRV